VKPFTISDNNALVISSGEGDFVLPVSFSRGILSRGFCPGGFVRFPLRCVAPFALRRIQKAVFVYVFDSKSLIYQQKVSTILLAI